MAITSSLPGKRRLADATTDEQRPIWEENGQAAVRSRLGTVRKMTATVPWSRGRFGSAAAAVGVALGAVVLAAGACGTGPGFESGGVRLDGETMGTRWMVRVRGGEGRTGPDAEALRALRAVVERELDAVDRAMSNWREDSEVSRWNARSNAASEGADAEGGSFRARPISEPLAEVVAAALAVHRASGGAFDLTVPPLLRLFGFGPGGDPSAAAPTPAAVEAARARVGSDRLRLERGPDGEAVLHAAAGIELDLSGIAKGYAVDRVSEALSAGGWSEHLVEVGGEIRASGAWTVGVETPLPGPLAGLVTRVQRSFPVADLAVATSGGYRDFREAPEGVPPDGVLDEPGAGDGEGPARRYWTHLFDPRLGRPVERRAGSVTVLAPSCLRADAWATALFVLGPDAGFALAERRGLPALFLTAGDDGAVADRATAVFVEATRPRPD